MLLEVMRPCEPSRMKAPRVLMPRWKAGSLLQCSILYTGLKKKPGGQVLRLATSIDMLQRSELINSKKICKREMIENDCC